MLNQPFPFNYYPAIEFYSEDLKVERKQWTEDDRRMSEFFMKSLANFARYGYVCLYITTVPPFLT